MANKVRALALVLFSACIATLTSMLAISLARQQTARDEAIRALAVVGEVADARTLGTDELSLRQEIVDLFLSPGAALEPFVTEVGLGRSCWYSLDTSGNAFAAQLSTPPLLLGVNRLSIWMPKEMQPEITYRDGYSNAVLQSDADVCVISEAILKLLPGSTLEIAMRDRTMTRNQPHGTWTLTVAGTYAGAGDDILVPYVSLMRKLESLTGQAPRADRLSFVLSDNHQLAEFRERAKLHFAAGALSDSGMPYTLLLRDEVLKESTAPIERNIRLLRIIVSILIPMSFPMGVLIAFLHMLERKREFAVLRAVGVGRPTLLLEAMAELVLLLLFSLLATLLMVCLLSGGEAPNAPVLLGYGALFLLGGLIWAVMATRVNVARSLSEEA